MFKNNQNFITYCLKNNLQKLIIKESFKNIYLENVISYQK